MENDNCVVQNKRYKYVPPDGGWGYLICVAAIINNLAFSMFAGSFGVIYKDFLIKLDMGSTHVTLLNSINLLCAAFSGFFTSNLLKFMSMRVLALIATTLFNGCALATVFINSRPLFFITQAIQSTGTGFMYSISTTIINDYFVKKRLLAISLVQTVTAVGGMVAPLIVDWSLETLEFRSTLIVMCCVYMHSFVSVALMQPVSEHMVKVELEDSKDELKLLMVNKNVPDACVATPIITLTNTDSPLEADINLAEQGKKSKDSKNVLLEIFEVKLLKKFLLSNASMGPAFCMFSDILFSLMLPQALFAMNWNKDTVAQAISLAAFGDLMTRVGFVFFNKWLTKLGNQEIYLISVAIAFAARLCMLWSENQTAILIFITMIGVARCSIMVLPPLLLADIFTPDQFTRALGVYMMVLGLMNFVLGPAIGAIRDHTNSYSTAFYVLTSCYGVVLLLWSIELVYKRNKDRRRIQREAAEKFKLKKNVKKNKV